MRTLFNLTPVKHVVVSAMAALSFSALLLMSPSAFGDEGVTRVRVACVIMDGVDFTIDGDLCHDWTHRHSHYSGHPGWLPRQEVAPLSLQVTKPLLTTAPAKPVVKKTQQSHSSSSSSQ